MRPIDETTTPQRPALGWSRASRRRDVRDRRRAEAYRRRPLSSAQRRRGDLVMWAIYERLRRPLAEHGASSLDELYARDQRTAELLLNDAARDVDARSIAQQDLARVLDRTELYGDRIGYDGLVIAAYAAPPRRGPTSGELPPPAVREQQLLDSLTVRPAHGPTVAAL